ncbi:hypothetical protein C7S20_16940 [Christiangramia fulva]|uniref:Nuclear transport factor 2 family protein n=1 Tax=Christiangramia fulva TaxID=2126553 RepID=A0A2R3Z954_9FLAO|nr:hypothetical protein [Christiangramia fulva]AVR46811.1 hypothetical protein C7S20_16940 [Christiangramia fulva]
MKVTACLMLFFYSIIANSQNEDFSEKVSSIDSIVSAVYQVISGKKGEDRNWKLHKTIFHPKARIISNFANDKGEYEVKFLSVDEYIDTYRDYFKGIDLYEKDLIHETEVFGNMAQVFSTYGSFSGPNDSEPFKIGTASIQLYNDGNRWYVLNMYYKNENEDDKIPQKYLPVESTN